jgi:cephalosporin hydroxylase
MISLPIRFGRMSHLNLDKVHDGLSYLLYRGVAIQKFPFDYIMYQMIINEIRPDLIIEIGTMHGGSALYFADLQDILNIEGGEVHTIDLIDPYERKRRDSILMNCEINPDENINYPDVVAAHPRIKTFSDGYWNYNLDNCKNFKTILLIDDGSHVYEEVLEVMNKFKDLISVGSYLIIEDGNALEVCHKEELRRIFNGGPLRAIYRFLSENDNFRVDYKWCDMFGINSTYNTYGYLKKIK